MADPNAGAIAALAAAAFTALASLTAACFGIKVATEQSERANATAGMALQVGDNAHHAKRPPPAASRRTPDPGASDERGTVSLPERLRAGNSG